MQIKFYEIWSFQRHSWISFNFCMILEGVNEIETAVTLPHLIFWMTTAWCLLWLHYIPTLYCAVWWRDFTKETVFVFRRDRDWKICAMVLNLPIWYKWSLGMFTGHFPMRSLPVLGVCDSVQSYSYLHMLEKCQIFLFLLFIIYMYFKI